MISNRSEGEANEKRCNKRNLTTIHIHTFGKLNNAIKEQYIYCSTSDSKEKYIKIPIFLYFPTQKYRNEN